MGDIKLNLTDVPTLVDYIDAMVSYAKYEVLEG